MAFLTLACERARPFGGLLKERVTGEKGGKKNGGTIKQQRGRSAD